MKRKDMKRKITIRRNRKESIVISDSDLETQALAETLAASLLVGSVLALSGDLGAGKTTFVKGLAKGLKVSETVTSPTFVLMNVYDARTHGITQFVHIDCYRLEKSSDFSDIGCLEYLSDPHTVTAIEWPERVKTLLPQSTIWIVFECLQ